MRLKSDGHYIQGYKGQLAVASDHQVIVALGVSNQAPDVKHLEPWPQASAKQLGQRIVATAGALPAVMTADTGYWSESNAELWAEEGIDAYIATDRLAHGQTLPPKRGPMPRDADARTRMACKLRSKTGSRI